MSFRSGLLLALVGLALGACNNPFDVFAPTHAETRAAGWVFPAAERTPTLAIRVTGFCYQTLAAVDCYTTPVPGLERRLVADPPILIDPPPYRR